MGEYGPEIVQGPAHVTGREATARKLGNGGGGEYAITLAPQIAVTVEAGGDSAAAEEQGRRIAAVAKAAVMSTLVEQTRPNGVLDNWIRSKR